MFEKDERFQAIERAKDCEDIFEEHLEELKKKVLLSVFTGLHFCSSYYWNFP